MANETGGRNTFKGLNAQAVAAISLFLQHLTYRDLVHISFEQPKLKDFVLVFKTKKIIFESKALRISYADIRDILTDINNLGERDEIVIICEAAGSDVKSDLENYKYFEEIKEKLIKKGFTDHHFKLLPHLKPYEVSKEESEKIAVDLFAKVLGIWVPDKDFQEILDSLVLRKVYFGSEAGTVLTKQDFYAELETRKKEIQARSGYYSENDSKIKKIEEAYTALQDPSNKRDWSEAAITSLTGSPDVHYQTLQVLKTKTELNLKEWNSFWEASLGGAFTFEVLKIFKENAKDPENQEYLAGLFPKISSKLNDYYRDRFYFVEIGEICDSIADSTRKHDRQIFEIFKALLKENGSQKLFVNTPQNDEWEKERLSLFLKNLYTKTDDKKLKEEIIEFIFEEFNLVEDDGDFWHEAPNEIFEILKEYASEDSLKKIAELSKRFSKQFQDEYKKFGKGLEYAGFEHMSGSNDRHFITMVLSPALEKAYSDNPSEVWEFVKNTCITLDEKAISIDHPDFMNRIPLKILVWEYEKEPNKKEAFEILSKLVLMKGIPTKAEFIFKLIKDSASLSADDKWAMVLVQLNYPPFKGLPWPSVEALTIDLANSGSQDALKKIEDWSVNPEYNKRKGFFEDGVIDNIPNLLKKEETKEKGIEMLATYLDSDGFKNDQDKFKVWDIAQILAEVIRVDFAKGIEMITKIWGEKSLTKNQQTILASTLSNFSEKDSLKEIYDSTLSIWLKESGDDIKKIEKIFSDPIDRASLVAFGEKLADATQIDAALRIARIFISDSDQDLKENSLHKKVEEGEIVHTLNTVRAKVCFLIEKMTTDSGKKHIKVLISLANTLLNDPNYYVRANACHLLVRLVSLRRTYVKEGERYMDNEDSDAIKKLLIEALDNSDNQRISQITEGLVNALQSLRDLSEEEAIEVFECVQELKNSKAVAESMGLWLYYSEFRRDAHKGEQYKKLFGQKELEELNSYNGQEFKKRFIAFIKSKNFTPESSADLAWVLWKLPKEDRMIKVALEYFPYLVVPYDQHVYTNIYYFIDENIAEKYKEVIEIWKQCVVEEKKFLEANLKDNFHELFWVPFHNNGKILTFIQDNEGDEEFLKYFDLLLSYPENAAIASDLDLAVDRLSQMPCNDATASIFDKLVNREGKYFEARKTWLGKEETKK